MKYTLEVTEQGFKETIEAGEHQFEKNWIIDDGWRTRDTGTKYFTEQFEDAGIDDSDLLDKLFVEIDEAIFPTEMFEVFQLLADEIPNA